MEASGVSRTRHRRRRRRGPDLAWLRKLWLPMIAGAVVALGFLFAKLITRV